MMLSLFVFWHYSVGCILSVVILCFQNLCGGTEDTSTLVMFGPVVFFVDELKELFQWWTHLFSLIYYCSTTN